MTPTAVRSEPLRDLVLVVHNRLGGEPPHEPAVIVVPARPDVIRRLWALRDQAVRSSGVQSRPIVTQTPGILLAFGRRSRQPLDPPRAAGDPRLFLTECPLTDLIISDSPPGVHVHGDQFSFPLLEPYRFLSRPVQFREVDLMALASFDGADLDEAVVRLALQRPGRLVKILEEGLVLPGRDGPLGRDLRAAIPPSALQRLFASHDPERRELATRLLGLLAHRPAARGPRM